MTGPVITMKRFAIGLAAVAAVLLAFAIHRVTARGDERARAARARELAERESALAERLAETDRRLADLQDRLARPPLPALPARPIGADDDIDRATIDRLRLYDGHARGPITAHVTIVIFLDMQCPYCKRTIEALDTLWSEYPDNLRLVPKHYPVRAGSERHAQALYSTTSEDAYWKLFDLLYADPAGHDDAALRRLAEQAGADIAFYDFFFAQRAYQSNLDADRAAADALSVRATPVIFVNGRRFVGARTVEQLRDAIDAALASPAP
jgi:protein-disulfide isomerase